METTTADLFYRGALALALGLIIGFQRERKATTQAGIRTFPLFALAGFFCASLEQAGFQWVVAVGLLAVTFLLSKSISNGVTTEMAGLLVFLLGVSFRVFDEIGFVVVVGGVCALILHLKEAMHGWVERLNGKEVQAIMQFVLIALVILPLLPDKSFDQFEVLNPRKIWLMVVLITGISLISFSVQKIVGSRAGAIWTGILGGLISSTATTVTLARASAQAPANTFLVAPVIIASTAAFIRILAEILIVAPGIFLSLVFPLSTLFLFMCVVSALVYFRSQKNPPAKEEAVVASPSQLKAALVFGALFAVVLYLSAWVRQQYGHGGSMVVSIISGLIDVDAITLSTAQLMNAGTIKSSEGWRLIMTAFLSNLAFKAMLVASLARGSVRKQIIVLFSISLAAGVLIMLFF